MTTPNAAGGHGPFSAPEIDQIMAETGYDYDRVCRDIDASGAATKQDLYPQFYAGEGIQPQPGAAPPAATPAPAPVSAAPPDPAAVPPPTGNQTPVTEPDTLPPEALAALRAQMAPPEAAPPQSTPQSGPAQRQRMRRPTRY